MESVIIHKIIESRRIHSLHHVALGRAAKHRFPDGDGAPVLLKANTVDAAQEKHVPVIEIVPEGMLVKIGSVPHPMIDAHFIEFVEVIDGKNLYRHYFNPGDKPEVIFELKYHDGMTVREYCNIHGLWQK